MTWKPVGVEVCTQNTDMHEGCMAYPGWKYYSSCFHFHGLLLGEWG